jgi:SNF2 family DNA or RNA helicase
MICDESHRLKKHSSRQSKSAHRVGREIKYKYALTGTPIGNDEIDLFAQFRFLDDGLLGDTWGTFKKRYCRPYGYGGYKTKLRAGSKRRFFKKLAPYQFQIKKREALDLPPEIDLDIEFELTGAAAKAYKELERDFYTQYEDMEVMTELAITNLLRLQQLTGGFLDNGEEILQLEQNKLWIFMDWLQDYPQDKKLVIFARFTPEIDILHKNIVKSGRTCAVLDGRTKQKDRNLWEKFQDECDPITYIAQIGSGGLGIELFAADVAVFYSKSFSYIQYTQARGRLVRDGQKNKVEFIHLIGKKTVDTDNEVSLQQKGETSEDVLCELRNRRRTMAARKITSKKDTRKKTTPPPFEKPDYGVDYLAEQLDVETTTVRVKLRSAGIKKSGRVYDFGTKKEADEVVKQLRAIKDKPAKKKPAAKKPATTKKARRERRRKTEEE